MSKIKKANKYWIPENEPQTRFDVEKSETQLILNTYGRHKVKNLCSLK